MVKKSKGRQKIEMVKMENESNLQVTFSKRRSGLFKKASELCTLCGAEVALIVFSPGRKVFSFGHPCVESIIDRFMNNNLPPNNNLLPPPPPPPPPYQQNNMQLGEAHQNSTTIQELNNNLTEILNEFEVEKKKSEEIKKIREKTKMDGDWREDAIEGMNMAQVNQFKADLDNLKKIVAVQASKLFQAHLPQQMVNMNANFNNNGGFGVDGGGNNVNPNDLDMFNQGRMMNMNAFNNMNQTANLPTYALSFGNNVYSNVPEGFVQDPNMNYIPDYNQNQNLTFKREDTSEYEHHHGQYPPSSGPHESFGYFHGHPPPSGPGPSGYYLGYHSQSGDGSSSSTVRPSDLGIGPSSFGAGPSGFGAGPSDLGIGLSGLGIGPSGSGAGPSGYYQDQHSQYGAGPSDAEAGPSGSRAGPSNSRTEPSGYYQGHPPHSGPSGYYQP